MAMKCEPCGKSFTGIVSYNQHNESDKHKRKLSILQFQNRNVDQQTVGNPADAPKIPCSVCNVSFDTIDSFKAHVMTREHASNINKSDVKDNPSYNNVSSTVSNDCTSGGYRNTVRPSGDETDTILPPGRSFVASAFAPFVECKLCNKQFSGPEPYQQHTVSAGHIKKVELEKFLSEQGSNQNVSKIFSCEPCKKVFSGQVPLEQHLVSNIHKKKLQNVQLLEQFKANTEFHPTSTTECDSSNNVKTVDSVFQDMDSSHPWYCKICLVQCSGLIPFQQHIKGESHWKNQRKLEVAKSFTTVDNKSGGLLNSSNAVVPTPVLIPEINRSSQEIELAPKIVTISEVKKYCQDTEFDTLLPQAMQNLLVSPDDIDLKEFLPHEKIDFDYAESKTSKGTADANTHSDGANSEFIVGEENMSVGSVEETLMENVNVYEVCELCNVTLVSKEDAKSHYESLEHFKRRWR